MINKKGDYDFGRKVLYIFMALVFLTLLFVAFIVVLNSIKEESFKTKDFIEGSAIKYTLTHSTNCFASDKYETPVIDIGKFKSENLEKCTKELKRYIRAGLFVDGKLFKDWISNQVGGYKTRTDSALVFVEDNGLKPMEMRLEYGTYN